MSSSALAMLTLALLASAISISLNVAPIIEVAVRWRETRRLMPPQSPVHLLPVIAAALLLFVAVIWL